MAKNSYRLIRVTEETYQDLLKKKEELDKKKRSFDRVIQQLKKEAESL